MRKTHSHTLTHRQRLTLAHDKQNIFITKSGQEFYLNSQNTDKNRIEEDNSNVEKFSMNNFKIFENVY